MLKIGDRVSRLTLLKRAGRSASNNYLWECKCDCGKITTVYHGNLQRKHTESCGCLNKEVSSLYNATKTLSDKTKAKISAFFKGRPSGRKGCKHSPETIEKLRIVHTGKKMSDETRRKLSESIRGEKSVHWKGGVNAINDTIRKSVEYDIWREGVYKRDDWTCQTCKQKGGRLNPHHKKAFSLYPEIRFDIDNGITLCQKCHKELHKIEVPRIYNSEFSAV